MKDEKHSFFSLMFSNVEGQEYLISSCSLLEISNYLTFI